MGEFVHVETDQAIATIRLDRPPMNALSSLVQEELAAAAAQVGSDPAVAAVILYGGGKVPDSDVCQTARDLVAGYAGGPALALRAARQAVDDGLETDPDAGDRAAALRRPVRDRGPASGNAQLH